MAKKCNQAKRMITIPMVLILMFQAQEAFSSHPDPSREYQIKAVFLYNFAQFVDWPRQSFPEKDSPLIIGVLGDDPFGGYLDEIIAGENVGGHPIVVKRYKDVVEVDTCHILFINLTRVDRLDPVLAALKPQNVLTVGDTRDFIQQGGILRFFLERGKTRMQINLEAAKKANLKISSKLLRVADIVTAKNQ